MNYHVGVIFMTVYLWMNPHLGFCAEAENVWIPQNISVTRLTPSTALVTWCYDANPPSMGPSDDKLRLEITYKPLRQRKRMVVSVPTSTTSYQLENLLPGTVYSVSLTSISSKGRVKSPRTLLTMPQVSLTDDVSDVSDMADIFLAPEKPLSGSFNNVANNTTIVRAEEIGIVVLALIVWIGAITLFFHRWGKIRMLLPYQPVFKEEEPLVGLPSQASPNMAAQHTLQQQRVFNNTNKFSSSHPLTTTISPSAAATLRRNQFMERGNWPASMSRLDNLIIGRPTCPTHSSTNYRRANTIASGSRQPEEGSNNHSTTIANGHYLVRRKAHSAEVITLTVTECDTPDPPCSSDPLDPTSTPSK